MRSTIVKSGSGGAIHIPVRIMRAARLEIGQYVDICAVDGEIMIRSGRVQRYTLAELVEGITPDNQHGLIDFGNAIGREVW